MACFFRARPPRGHRATGDEKAARATIAEFLRLCEEGEITPVHVEDQDARECLLQTSRLLQRALLVDMDSAANRKGELPKALGLVSRHDSEHRTRNRVICLTFDHARNETGIAGRPREICASLVVRAIEMSGVFAGEDFTEEKVLKIYQRGTD